MKGERKMCFFSTFIDDKTITCSRDDKFDEHGFPINLCYELPNCRKIKEMNRKKESV